jgi:hypothetical protein
MGRSGGRKIAKSTMKTRTSLKSSLNWELIDGRQLTPGVIDQDAEDAYSYGQCAYLALAISEHTSGQIWAIVGPDYDDDGNEVPPSENYDSKINDSLPDHFGVEVDGEIVDINGYQNFDEWEERHGGYAVAITKEDVLKWQREHQRKGQWAREKSDQEQLDMAKTFVDPVLDS